MHILEYRVTDTELLDNAIFRKEILEQTVWYRIDDDYEFTVPEKNNFLTKHVQQS